MKEVFPGSDTFWMPAIFPTLIHHAGKPVIRSIQIIAITAFVLAAPSEAARLSGEEGPLKLDMDQCLAIALKQNVDLAIARNETVRAEAIRTEAIGVALPDVTFSATYTHNGNVARAKLFDEEFQLMPDDDVTFNVGLDQWLYSGSVGAGLRGANHLAAAARAREEAGRNDVIARVRELFYATLYFRDMVKVQEESVTQLRSLLADSKDREAVGLNTSYDTMRFETRLAQAIPALIDAKNAFEKAKSALLDSLGVDPMRRVAIDGELGFEPFAITGAEVIENALARRAELLVTKEEVSVAKAYMEATRSQQAPTLKAFANYRYTSTPGDLTGEEKWRDVWDAGLRLEMNLFDGRERSSRLRQKILELDNAQLSHERRLRQITLEAKNSYDEFVRAEEFVTSQRRNVTYAEETYRIATERHSAGLTTQLELLDTQLTLTRAKGDYRRSLYDYLAARARLIRAIGGPLTEERELKP